MNLRELVERRIQDAWEKGKFLNLRGEGTPQKLEENPFEDPEMRLAYKVLSNAGFAPSWVELAKELDAEETAAKRVWEDYRAHRRRQMAEIHRGSVARFAELVSELDDARDRALQRLERRWHETNKKISYFNAEVSTDNLKRPPLNVARRRERFEREFPRLGGILSAR